jgi:hypothetical protein
MVNYTIDVSELKESEKIKGLTAFLEKELEVKSFLEGKEIKIFVPEERSLPKKEIKAVLKRYLHSAAIKDDFRILSAPSPSFKIRKKPTP